MLSNRFAFVVLGVACVAAAAGGGYLATRQNAADRPTVAASTAAPSDPATLTAGGPAGAELVQETAATVGEAATGAHPVSPVNSASPATPVSHANPGQASAPSTKTGKPAVTTARNTPLPAVAQTSPSGSTSSTAQPAPVAVPQEPPAPVARQEEPPFDPVKAAEPERAPERTFDELVVTADSVIGLQMESNISSERARVEDRVDARVIRDVRVNGQVAIPSGAHAIGSVMAVERGGKFKERARLGIRFHTLVLADGTRLPVTTETIYRYGDAPGNSSAAKIGGGAVGGAILGAILGGAKGAAIGAAAGAGGGAAVVEAGDRNAATFANGAQLTARFLSPVTVTIEK
jgi:hypothetical protein